MKKLISISICLIILICSCSLAASAIDNGTHSDVRNSVIFVESADGIQRGSGFAIGEKGKPVEYFVTNAFVVEGATYANICYSLAENDFVAAEVVLKDPVKDIAVLKIPSPTEKRTPLVLCPNKYVDISDRFYLYGYPDEAYIADSFVKLSSDDIVMTPGSIAKPSTKFADRFYSYLLTIDSSNGSWGCPLVNEKGEAVAIFYDTLQVSDEEVATYAIIIDELISVLNTSTIEIKYDVHSFINPTLLIIFAVAAVAIILIIVIILTSVSRKKKIVAAGPAPVVDSANHDNINVTTPAYNVAPAPQPPKTRRITITAAGKCELSGRTFSDSELRIGRDPRSCNVVFSSNAAGISKLHCTIRLNGSVATITDNGSSFGTFLANGTKLTPNSPATLPNGGKFYLAGPDNTFEVRY